MAAYLISDVTVCSAEAFHNYRTRAAQAIAQFGGRYLARGGTVEQIEGCWAPTNIIIAEFPDMERARAWYRSPEYAAALEFRDEALTRNLIFVEGLGELAQGQ